MFEYHELTKHTVARLRRTNHVLDWANMPDPFRHYEGVPLIDLPGDVQPPDITALDVLCDLPGPIAPSDWVSEVSRLLFYAASISASKRAPSGCRYALRVNPSSGNLHPSEFHLATRGGLYHYRVSSHMLEQRGTGDSLERLGLDAPLAVILTSIVWREAWKYRERAYRYCLLDIGHAAEALRLSAVALGYSFELELAFDDDRISQSLGLSDEWPMAIALIRGFPDDPAPHAPARFLGGEPNRLSDAIVRYAAIDEIHRAGKTLAVGPRRAGAGPPVVTAASLEPFAGVVRRRRSALDFSGGVRHIPHDSLVALRSAVEPLQEFIQLYLYVHRVSGLEPGLYHHLELMRPGDMRVAAAGLSLGQDLAGNSCVTFSMVADLHGAHALWGNRGYRAALIEAGRIGHRFYVAAEALGFQSTGIGAFYDDEVHSFIGITPEEGQVVYHFACGYAVMDDRLSDTL
jgi:SagB-type dehydrogenase family enzyme